MSSVRSMTGDANDSIYDSGSSVTSNPMSSPMSSMDDGGGKLIGGMMTRPSYKRAI